MTNGHLPQVVRRVGPFQNEQVIKSMLLLDPILDEIRTLIDYHNATVVKWAGDLTVTVGYRGDAPLTETLQSSFTTGFEVKFTDWVDEQTPFLVSDVFDDSPVAQWLRPRLSHRYGEFSDHVCSMIVVRLAVGDRIVGLLGIHHRERGRYSPQDADLLQRFVEHRAADIEHAILYADAARLAAEAQAVLTVQQALVRHLDRDTILRKVAEEVLRLTSSRRALVFLCQEEQFRLVSSAGEPTPWLPLGWPTPIYGSLLGKVLEAGEPMSFDSMETLVQSGATVLPGVGNRSLLIFPLRSEDRGLGVIVAADKRVGMFGANDERMVAMLASSAIISLENARAHSQARRLARMNERQRIACSLHDTLAQMLFGIGMSTKKALEEPLLSESTRHSLQTVSRLSARSSEELRSAIFALRRPVVRGGHSLIDLLREQVQEFRSESNVVATFVAPESVEPLPHPVGEAIYRIVRESLFNVHKHAQATMVEVRLQCAPDAIVVTIQDDGIGLDESRRHPAIEQNLHFGVETMRQLANQVGGELTITNNAKRGVTVKARLPIQGGSDA
ncbi:MAG: GAF domain-containing protein [Actinobacteria bacterium]|nr:GAF domain-containing protein [Actinomycetota bacterium]